MEAVSVVHVTCRFRRPPSPPLSPPPQQSSVLVTDAAELTAALGNSSIGTIWVASGTYELDSELYINRTLRIAAVQTGGVVLTRRAEGYKSRLMQVGGAFPSLFAGDDANFTRGSLGAEVASELAARVADDHASVAAQVAGLRVQLDGLVFTGGCAQAGGLYAQSKNASQQIASQTHNFTGLYRTIPPLAVRETWPMNTSLDAYFTAVAEGCGGAILNWADLQLNDCRVASNAATLVCPAKIMLQSTMS